MPPSSSDDPRIRGLIGQILADRYRIDELIGIGGMGVVFRAHHLQLKRDVAVKVMLPEGTARQDAARRFMREAESAARLDHENCVRVYDFGVTADGVHYMVMPVLSGAPLKEAMEGPRVSPRRAMRLAAQLFAGLDHAHQRQVVHRDLKPDNLFLDRTDAGEDHLTIVDFGIAKILEADSHGTTEAGYLYGTPAYMSPEQAGGDPLDARSDLFSAGLVLYRMLTGHIPGRAKSALEQMRKRVSQEIPPLPDSFPDPVRELVAKLCALRPEDRFQSASEAADFVLEVLEAWDSHGETHDDLVLLPDDDATRVDVPIASTTLNTLHPSVTDPSITTEVMPRRGPSWIPWAAGLIAVGSFALAWFGTREAPAPTVASAEAPPPLPDDAAKLPLDDGDVDPDDEASPGTGSPKVQVPDARPELVAPPNPLQKLALVNEPVLGEALPYAHRHALLDELGDDPQVRGMIDQRVNLAMDLLQAGDAPEPCEVFSASLRAIEASADAYFLEALEQARVPASEDPRCATLDTERDRLARALGPHATSTSTQTKTPRPRPRPRPRPSAPTGEPAQAPGIKAGQIIEKLD